MKNLTDEKVKELLKKGKTIIQIAKEYNISRQAVYYHIEKLKDKKKKEPPKNNKSKINYNSKINWKVYNEGLVKRGEIIFDFEFFKNWKNELKEMNKNKIGSPYFFPETFIRFLLKLKSIFQIDYRTLEGIGRKILVIFVPEIKRFPDYTTIQNRLKKGRYKLEVYQREGLQDIAIDSSGLKTNKRGEYRVVQNKGRERKKRGTIDGIKMKDRLDLGRVKDEIKRIRRLIKLYKRKGKDSTRLIKRLNRLNRLKKYFKR